MSTWSAWVLEYAVAENFPLSLSIYGAHNRGARRAPFSYVVLKQNDNVVMVDVGFGETARQRQIAEDSEVTDWRDPHTVLAQIGLAPEQVTHVIVTHAHYDHFGNVSAFPNATFFLSARELEFWVKELALPPRLRTFVGPIDPADLIAAVDLSARGRLQLLADGAPQLFPGLDVLPAWDTHTPGSVYVRLDTAEGPLVLAGDNVYAWENVEGLDGDGLLHPVGLVVGSNLQATHVLDGMLKDVEEQSRRIIPVHEDRLRGQYPSWQSDNGAMVVEVALQSGEPSRIPIGSNLSSR
ncbi:putative hydrolase [Arthrobacter globiformis NBRC 12137]|uniref:Putative hydrolase n=1 Tax=Arthrobacter globiformis (strain ATCC 8010 / DSM 20124 / JCM 1332 / NBRC 12137 / NCIMB 8907 / NRRL B-2979 / 168) TaxID=1077972 RepID=H0QPQ8_ARTG1|nr:N-acyl homoserine lactonase family protein [Arthrobacter globiformis]GAB14809.1 putative hydrolase [Arthrobacter globiformis NBRC 12137]